MSEASPAEDLNKKSGAATDVGSYFISNYPPFSFWSTSHLDAVEEVLNQEPDPSTPLGLYLHIPFCRKRCKFCYFRVYTDKSSNEVEVYVDALTREMALYRDRALFANRPLRFVYFGGGTPSFLGSRQLSSLVERLQKSVSWEHAEEVTFECEPGTLSQSKVRALRDIGVTRLSLGIENFDDEVLRENGRAHLSEEVYRSYEWIRDAGFPQVNVDLIAGMVGETEENWRRGIEKVIELDPDSVTIYQMELPYNTVYSREILDKGEASPVAGWATKRDWVGYAFDELERVGYRVSSAYTMVKPSSNNDGDFSYRDSLWRGADLLGTGVASFSHIGGVHFQNLDGFQPYVEACVEGRLPLSRGYPVAPKERLIRELILQLKLGEIDAQYFRDKFGCEILEEFASVFDTLRDEGVLDWVGDRITLSREGLLRVDSLLPGFFLPEHRGARYT